MKLSSLNNVIATALSVIAITGLLVLVFLTLRVNSEVDSLKKQNSEQAEALRASTDLGQDDVEVDDYQAVFLNGGQVYFGKITSMNQSRIELEDVYYLRTQGDTSTQLSGVDAAADVSLVKLGCELHRPKDTMHIIRDQVIFWENLESDGASSVVGSIRAYKNQYPDGQQCL